MEFDWELKLALIPVIAGVIGFCTNWVAVKMLFFPVHFIGFRIPGLALFTQYLPRKIRAIPGVAQGGIGWQGIIPSRSPKMGSVAVDSGIAKVGSPGDFYQRLEPDKIAEQIVSSSGEEILDMAERIIQREHPQLWQDLPPQLRAAARERMRAHLPTLVKQMTDDIGESIDNLLDVKLMVIRRFEQEPELANRIFLDIGDKELRFIVRSGFYFGLLLGLPQVVLFAWTSAWWVLPLGGMVVGYLTNWIALRVIFEPVEPRKLGPIRLQGLFIRRQPEVAGVYAKVVADDVVNLKNVGDELMSGRNSDRTKKLIADRMRPAIDQTLGIAKGAVRVAVGSRQYDTIRDSVALEAVDKTMATFHDEEFGRTQSDKVKALISSRMKEMPPTDFSEMLRTALVEDEWMLIMLGAVLGLMAGVVQIALLFGGAT